MENPERLFACRLALALGKSLSEVMAMPMSEMTTWYAFYQLEPWGCPTDDERSAHMLTLFYSANSKPNSPIPTFYKRWPSKEKKEEAQPKNDLHLKIKGFFSAYASRKKAT